MKTRRSFRFGAASACALLVASAFPLLAQQEKAADDKAAAKQPETAREQRFQNPAARFIPAFGRFMEVLTDEQRTSLQEAMEGQREKVRELEGKARELRRAILEAAATQDFDESIARSKALALGKIEAELTVLR